MSDINKDIERVKELQSTIYEGGDYIYLNKNDKQALGNVLKELETRTVQVSGQVHDLETWKKISEKLAERLGKICIDTKPLVMGTIADEVHGCDKYISCKECFLDWARNEVEKSE